MAKKPKTPVVENTAVVVTEMEIVQNEVLTEPEQDQAPVVAQDAIDTLTEAEIDQMVDDAMADLVPEIDVADLSTTAVQDLVRAPVMSAEEIAQMIATGAVQDLAQDADQAPAEDASADQAPGDETTVSFKDLLAGITEARVAEENLDLLAAFAERANFEKDADASNTNIQKTLTKLIRSFSTPGVARALIAIGVDKHFVNENEVGSKRRNVYALEKMRDILYGAVTGHLKNAINLAALTSLMRLDAINEPFTGEVAKACASDKTACPAHLKALLRRHTVSESTASTQASSTMVALEVLKIVTNTGTRNRPVYKLTDTALTRHLRDMFKGQMQHTTTL